MQKRQSYESNASEGQKSTLKKEDGKYELSDDLLYKGGKPEFLLTKTGYESSTNLDYSLLNELSYSGARNV